MPGQDRCACGDGSKVVKVGIHRARILRKPTHALRGPGAHMRVAEDGGNDRRRSLLDRCQQVVMLAKVWNGSFTGLHDGVYQQLVLAELACIYLLERQPLGFVAVYQGTKIGAGELYNLRLVRSSNMVPALSLATSLLTRR